MPRIWDLELHACERPLTVTPGGTPEAVPNGQDTHAMHTTACGTVLLILGNGFAGCAYLSGPGKEKPRKGTSASSHYATSALSVYLRI